MKLPKEKFTLEEKISILKEGLDPEINTALEILDFGLEEPYKPLIPIVPRQNQQLNKSKT
jgi:hypothetical protein